MQNRAEPQSLQPEKQEKVQSETALIFDSKRTGKGYLSGKLCGFKLQPTKAIKKNVYEAFIDYLISLLV